jgi:hypothetical protein
VALKAADQFHVGIVVDDFESTLAELSAAGGYEWCEEMSRPTDVRYADGTTGVLHASFAYSKDAPRLEIIRSVPGTVWVPAASGVHHLGYWSDDLQADRDALVQAGFATEVEGIGPDGSPFWAYHRHPTGLRIELISRAAQPRMEEYFTTGVVPEAFKAAP